MEDVLCTGIFLLPSKVVDFLQMISSFLILFSGAFEFSGVSKFALQEEDGYILSMDMVRKPPSSCWLESGSQLLISSAKTKPVSILGSSLDKLLVFIRSLPLDPNCSSGISTNGYKSGILPVCLNFYLAARFLFSLLVTVYLFTIFYF